MVRVRPKPSVLKNGGLTRLVGLVSGLASILGITPMTIDYKTFDFTFALFSWTSLFSLIRVVVFNSPLSILPLVLSHGGYWKAELVGNKLVGNITEIALKPNITMNNPYAGDMAQIVLNLLSSSSLLYYVLPTYVL